MAKTAKLDKDKVWLGITPTLWWNDDFINIDIGIPFEQCISEMALAGFQGCSMGHKFPSDPLVMRAELEKRNLRVSEPWVSTYFTINEMKKQTVQKVRDQLKLMDVLEKGNDGKRRADLVVAEFGRAVNPLPVALVANCPIFDAAEWDKLIKGLHEIGKIAKDEGRNLCYHPHLGTGVMREDAVDKLMAETDPDLVHLLVDTGHLAAVESDPLAVTKRHVARVRHLHLKDIRADVAKKMRDKGWSFEQAIQAGLFNVVGSGDLGIFPEIFKVLAEANFAGWLIVEAEQNPAKANPLEYAMKARAYLREQLGW
ncbi:MAG: myo-inosose-2 dehydratase [Rhizobium sp.]|nr:myo-inosose-2 dehydratase [Rhizobium sp.]